MIVVCPIILEGICKFSERSQIIIPLFCVCVCYKGERVRATKRLELSRSCHSHFLINAGATKVEVGLGLTFRMKSAPLQGYYRLVGGGGVGGGSGQHVSLYSVKLRAKKTVPHRFFDLAACVPCLYINDHQNVICTHTQPANTIQQNK